MRAEKQATRGHAAFNASEPAQRARAAPRMGPAGSIITAEGEEGAGGATPSEGRPGGDAAGSGRSCRSGGLTSTTTRKRVAELEATVAIERAARLAAEARLAAVATAFEACTRRVGEAGVERMRALRG